MFSSTSLCSEQQLSGILIRELEDKFEPSFEFGLLGLLTEVLASNADGTRGLVGVDFSPRITALGLWRLSSSSLCLAWIWSRDRGEGDRLFYCFVT